MDALPPLNDARVNHGCTRFRQNPSDNEYSLIVAGGWLSGEYNPKVFLLLYNSNVHLYVCPSVINILLKNVIWNMWPKFVVKIPFTNEHPVYNYFVR